MRPGPRNLITDVPGLRIGNAHDRALRSGTTVLTADQPFVAAVHVMGGSPGTRETDLLAPDCMVQAVDAIFPPSGYPEDRHAAAYLRSLRRAEADRRALQRQLRGLGWEVVPVPAISSEEVSINSINGVQDARRYLMPAYGGFFEPLDREAEAAFAAALGSSVEIVPILTGETQRRGGGLHCAVSAMAGL